MPPSHNRGAAGTQKSDPPEYLQILKLRTHTNTRAIISMFCMLCVYTSRAHLGLHLDIAL